MHIYIRAKEWAHWAFLKLFRVHLHTQENALWISPEWSGPVQNLDSMSGHAVQIFWSGQPCTSVWTESGPDLDQIWTESGIGQKPSRPILATTHYYQTLYLDVVAIHVLSIWHQDKWKIHWVFLLYGISTISLPIFGIFQCIPPVFPPMYAV
jgi:hypothetical protein